MSSTFFFFFKWSQLSNEPVMRRITTDKATKRMRQILSDAEWVSLLALFNNNYYSDVCYFV